MVTGIADVKTLLSGNFFLDFHHLGRHIYNRFGRISLMPNFNSVILTLLLAVILGLCAPALRVGFHSSHHIIHCGIVGEQSHRF